MGERTGSRIFHYLWSYVLVLVIVLLMSIDSCMSLSANYPESLPLFLVSSALSYCATKMAAKVILSHIVMGRWSLVFSQPRYVKNVHSQASLASLKDKE
ncbi:hypothetical protein DER45DRAFT_352191 [Fusarium avenaceum]|nr:hypothetical protein DER45DRAFT_352191 [Fusarium avenaceum]